MERSIGSIASRFLANPNFDKSYYSLSLIFGLNRTHAVEITPISKTEIKSILKENHEFTPL
jgi:hypothetical protein